MDIKSVGSLHSRGIHFQYFCQGQSHSSNMILRQGNVNKQVADICTTDVRITFSWDDQRITFKFDLVTNTMIVPEYPDGHLNSHGRDADILASFLHSHNLILTWLDVGISADILVSRISF